MTYRYRLAFEPDDNGTVLVTSPDFPPLATFGDNEVDARRHAADALLSLIASMIEAADSVPPPYEGAEGGPSISLPLLASLKIELHRALLDSRIDRIELQRRLGWRKDAIDRLFRLTFSSRIVDLEAAFHALGRDIAIGSKREPVAVAS